MPSYKAPVEDVLFLLNDVFHLDRYNNLPGFADATPDTVEAIILINRMAVGDTVDRGRRDMHNSADACGARAFEHLSRAFDIGRVDFG